MSLATYNVTVSNTAIALFAASAAVTDRRVTIYNNGAATIYVGPADTVTAAAGSNNGGLPIPVGAALTLDQTSLDTIFAIAAAAGSNDVRVLAEVGP